MSQSLRTRARARARDPHPVVAARMSIDRGWIVNLVNSRWFALADLATVSIGVALWTAQTLDPDQVQIGGWPLILALVPWGIRVVAGGLPFQRTRLDLPIAVLLLTAAMGVWTAYDREFAWAKFWLIVGGIMLLYALAGQPSVNHWLLAGALGLLGIVMASYFLLTHDWELQSAKIEIANMLGLRWMEVRPTFDAPVMNPNHAAGITAMMTPFLVAIGIRGWRERRILTAIGVATAGGLILMALLLATSRGVWVAVGAAMGACILWGLSNRTAQLIGAHRSRLFVILLLFVFSIFLLLVVSDSGGLLGLIDRLPGPPNAGQRYDVARDTLTLIRDYPFTGGGLGGFPGLYSHYVLAAPILALQHGHNLYLDVTLELGLFGSLAFLALLLGSVRYLTNKFRRAGMPMASGDILSGAALAALIVMSVHGLVTYGHQGAPLLFLLVGMAISLTYPDSTPDPESRQAFLWVRVRGLDSRKVAAAVILLIAALAMLYSYRRSLLSSWYANLGALAMAQVELAGWPGEQVQAEDAAAQLGTAEALFHIATRLDPTNRTANHRLGLIDFEQQDFGSAVVRLEQAYQQDEQHRGIWRSLGASYVWSGGLDKISALDEDASSHEFETHYQALASWWRAERDANDWLWVAYEAVKAGNEGLAIDLMQQQTTVSNALARRVVAAAGEVSEAFLARVQMWVGAGDYKSLDIVAERETDRGRLDGALLAYHAMQAVDGERGVSHLAKFLWHEEGDPDLAEAILRKGLEVYPDSQSVSGWLRRLDDLLRSQGRWEEAQTVIEGPEGLDESSK